MGPRLFRRGNFKRPPNPAIKELLQWGHVFSDVETIDDVDPGSLDLSFNGATSFQTWKHNMKSGADFPPSGLQWGPVFSDVET